MAVSNWTRADSDRAQQIWTEYQQHHDLSKNVGKTAGIDPLSGHIWIGDSIQDVIAQRDADGSEVPLFFIRVGSATYYRKGGHRIGTGLLSDYRLWIDFPAETVRIEKA
jgi:hypothetical protein